jgi:hypothetical protein
MKALLLVVLFLTFLSYGAYSLSQQNYDLQSKNPPCDPTIPVCQG